MTIRELASLSANRKRQAVLSACLHNVQNNCAKLFLLELHQMSTNFDNIGHKNGQEDKLCRMHLIFMSIDLCQLNALSLKHV